MPHDANHVRWDNSALPLLLWAQQITIEISILFDQTVTKS